jgi:hypothetical protein
MQIFRSACLNESTNDERCRFEFKQKCKEDPNSSECVRFEAKSSERFCESNSGHSRCAEIKQRAEVRGIRHGFDRSGPGGGEGEED